MACAAARLRMAGLLVAMLLVASGCQVRVDVGVDVEADGHGAVRVAVGLDPEAAALVPDLAAQLRVDDLEAAGWEVTGPVEEPDGLTWVRAAKAFDAVEEVDGILEEVSGPEGPFREFSVERDRALLRDRFRFTGVVDLGGGIEGFSDEDLRERLGGPLDAELGGLGGRLDRALDEAFRFRVVARLPGDIDANAPVVTDDAAVWAPTLGERATLAASSSLTRWVTAAWFSAAAAALVALAGLLAWRWRRRRRSHRSHGGPPAGEGAGPQGAGTDDVTPAA